MGPLSFLKGLFSSPKSPIGNTTPVCPYCSHHFDKMPARKKKCPNCSNEIYVRTRPNDKVRILVTKDQLIAVEELWSIANGTHGAFLAVQQRRQKTADELRQRFGREPSMSDVEWAILNEDVLAHARQMDWGLYRNARFSMAEILTKEGKSEQALAFLLEVCYLDLNGPRNCGGQTAMQVLREYPPFDPKSGFLAPGVTGRILDLMESTDTEIAELQSKFSEIASRVHQQLKLPLDPLKAWSKVKRVLKAS